MPRARGSDRSSGSSSRRSRGRRKVVAEVPRRSSRRLRNEEVVIESDDDDDDDDDNYHAQVIDHDEEFGEWMHHDVMPFHEENDGGKDPLAQPDFVIPDDDYEGQVYVHGVLASREHGTVIIRNSSEMEREEQHSILEDETDPLECDNGIEVERSVAGEMAEELTLHDGLAVMVLSPSQVSDLDEDDGDGESENIEVITLSDDSDDDDKKLNTYQAVDSLSIFNDFHSPNSTANNHSLRELRSSKSARAMQSSNNEQKSLEAGRAREPENITYTITPTLLEVAAQQQRIETVTSNEVCESGAVEPVVSHMSSDSKSRDPLQYCSEENNATEGEETMEISHSDGGSPEKTQYLEVMLEEGRCSLEKELLSADGSKLDELNEQVNNKSSPSSPIPVDGTPSLTPSEPCLVVINEELGDTTLNCDISDPLSTEGIIAPVESSVNMADERTDENTVVEELLVNTEDSAVIQDESEQQVQTSTKVEDLERVSSDIQPNEQPEMLTKQSKRGGNRKRGRRAQKSNERLPSIEKQKAVRTTRMGSRRGRFTRLASKSSSTTETSSEAEAMIRLQDEMQKEAKQMQVLSGSSSEDNYAPSGHEDDDDDSVTNDIIEPKRKAKYRTRLGRKNLARYKAEMAENSKKANKSSSNSGVPSATLPAISDVVVTTVCRNTSEDPETPLAKEAVERKSPPDLGPPVLSPIASEKTPNESMLDETNKDESAIISSTDNSFEIPQSSSAEELPDIDDVPLPVPPSLQVKTTENDAAVIVPTTATESIDKSAPGEMNPMHAMDHGDSGGKRNDVFRDVIKKTIAPAGVKKHLYTVEHRNYLYRDGAFVAEREDLGLEGSIFLWRILKKEKKLQKFVPVLIDKKECHHGVSIFLPLENMDEDFYNKYQPVLFDLLGNSDDFVIGMHYNISRCLPVLGYFPLSDHLYEHFQYFLKFMTVRAMVDHDKMPTEGEIRARVGPAVNAAVEAVENHIAKTIEGIMFRNQWPRDVVYCLLEYPHLALTKVGLKKNLECEPCRRLGKQGVAAFKLAFHGNCYDPDTLAVTNKEGGAWPDYQYCYSCPQSLRALHRLVHFKYWVFMAIRLQLQQQYKRLKPGQKFQSQEMSDYITKDFVWTKRMFYEFQTICGEGIQAKERTDRLEKTQVKKVMSAAKEKRSPGRPPLHGSTQSTPKKIVAAVNSESSPVSPKRISLLSEQEPEMPTIELCNYEDIAAPSTNNSSSTSPKDANNPTHPLDPVTTSS